jgi:hypothetical protein
VPCVMATTANAPTRANPAARARLRSFIAYSSSRLPNCRTEAPCRLGAKL